LGKLGAGDWFGFVFQLLLHLVLGVAMKKEQRESAQEKAYNMRIRTRMFWTQIATHTGYSCSSSCQAGAKAYAERNHLQWPLPGALTKAEMAYMDYRDGDSFEDIRLTLDLATKERARKFAYSWAMNNNLPWPPLRQVEEKCDYTNAMKTRLDEP